MTHGNIKSILTSLALCGGLLLQACSVTTSDTDTSGNDTTGDPKRERQPATELDSLDGRRWRLVEQMLAAAHAQQELE